MHPMLHMPDAIVHPHNPGSEENSLPVKQYSPLPVGFAPSGISVFSVPVVVFADDIRS